MQGLEKLCNSLTNSKITKIEIDEVNRSCSVSKAQKFLDYKLFDKDVKVK